MSNSHYELPSCGACRTSTGEDDAMTCKKCASSYHFLCLCITENAYKGFSVDQKAAWSCPDCCRHLKKGNYLDTPVRSSMSFESPVTVSGSTSPSWVTQRQRLRRNFDDSDIVTQEQSKHNCLTNEDIVEAIRMEMRHSMTNEIRQIIRETISSELNEIKSEITTLKNEVTSFRETVNLISHNYEGLKQNLEKKTELISQLQDNFQALKYSNIDVNDRLDKIEQHSRGANLEIQCVPEQPSENLITIVQQLAKTVSFELKENDIHLCTRTAKMDPNNSRPRSIVLKLNSPRTRDSFLAATIKFNKKHPGEKLHSNHLGIPGISRPVFVGEHLSPRNKELHRAARLKAKEKDYKFVWVRGGRVFVRKSERDQAVVIKDLNQIDNL